MFQKETPVNTEILISSTPKAIIISTVKIATRYIADISYPQFYKMENNEIELSRGTEASPDRESEDLESIQEISDVIMKDWDAMISGKLSKDIIILIRNPLNRLQTAMVQDVVTAIPNLEQQPLIYDWLKLKGYDGVTIEKFKNRIGSMTNLEQIADMGQREILDSKKEKEVREVLIDLISVYVRFYLDNPEVSLNHNTSYLPHIVGLLLSTRIDRNKITFVDIDDKDTDVDTILDACKVKDIVPKNGRARNKTTFSNKTYINDIMSDVIKELGGIDKFTKKAHGEFIAYNQIKKLISPPKKKTKSKTDDS